MHRKPYRNLVLTLAGLGLIAAAIYFYAKDPFALHTITFTTYPTLADPSITAKDFDQFVTLHNECFEEVKRKQLYSYLLTTKYAGANEYVQGLVKKQVNSYIDSSRVEKKTSLKETANVTLVRKGERVIGLYNCRDDFAFTNGSVMIYNVCLSASERGKGYGEKTMLHAIERCHKPGRDLTLSVYKDNTSAIKLYEKLHFKFVELINDPGDDFNFYNKFLMQYNFPK